MKYLNYDNYCTLISKIGQCKSEDAADDADFLFKATKSFLKYVDEVVISETGIKLIDSEGDSAEIRAQIEAYDYSRHIAHEAAIANTAILNKICAAYGVGPVFLGDITKRLEVAVFCIELIEQIYLSRRI